MFSEEKCASCSTITNGARMCLNLKGGKKCGCAAVSSMMKNEERERERESAVSYLRPFGG